MDIVEELANRAAGYRSGGPSSEHTAKLLDEAAAEITRLRDENEELKSQIVMECNEDEVPTFNQGLIEHELLEVVTAKRLDTLVALVVSLRARLAEAEAAKADAWDEGFAANNGEGTLWPDNPYRSKTDET